MYFYLSNKRFYNGFDLLRFYINLIYLNKISSLLFFIFLKNCFLKLIEFSAENEMTSSIMAHIVKLNYPEIFAEAKELKELDLYLLILIIISFIFNLLVMCWKNKN